MRRFVLTAAVLFLLFSSASAFCQSIPREETITEDEYAIYRLTLETVGGASSIDEKTLDGGPFEADSLRLTTGIRPDDGILQNWSMQLGKIH